MKRPALPYKYLLYTFIPSYLLGFLYLHLVQEDASFSHTTFALALLVIYMWIPGLMVLLLKRTHLRQSLRQFGLRFNPNIHWFGAWLYPLALTLLTIIITLVFGWGRLDLDFSAYLQGLSPQMSTEDLLPFRLQLESLGPGTLLLLMILQAVIAGATINALAALGEELGWRGFLYHHFRYMGFWKANLLIGFIWGLWHAPIIAAGYNFPQHPYGGIFIMIAATMALSPLIGYVRERSGSVIAAAIFHGVFNAIANLSILIIADSSNVFRSPLGLAGIIAMLILIAVSYLLFGLGRNPSTAEQQ